MSRTIQFEAYLNFLGGPVWEDSESRPDSTNVLAAIRVGQEDLFDMTTIVSRVVVGAVLWIWNVDCGVDDWDVMLSTGV